MRTKKDRETWVVTFHSQNNSTKNIDMYIQSDDFFTDARLYLEGDFVNEDEKAEYAQRICDLLNRDFPAIKEQNTLNISVSKDY
jgi:hypothetical protein